MQELMGLMLDRQDPLICCLACIDNECLQRDILLELLSKFLNMQLKFD